MESLCSSTLHPNYSPFCCYLRPVPIIPKPFFPRVTPTKVTKPSLKPSPPHLLHRAAAITGARHHPSPANPEPAASPRLSLLKPLPLAVAAAAASFAVLLSRFPSFSPSLALAATASSPVSDTLIEPQPEPEPEPDSAPIVAALRAEVESKIEQGDFTGSIQTLDRLISLHPSNSIDLYLLKAHLQSHLGDVTSARRSFEGVLEKDPFLVEAYHGLIVAMSNSPSASAELRAMMERVEKTIQSCKRLTDSKEKVRDFQLLLAQIKVILGEYEEPLRVYGEMEREEPSDFRPYLCKGIVYTLLKRKEEAEVEFEKYKNLVPQGHPYERFFDEMVGMKVFGEIQEEAKKYGSLDK